MARPVRLHLGSGRHYWPGWTNVDLVDSADVRCDVTDLSQFADGSVEEIQAVHLFEHLPRLSVLDTLREWRRVLVSGGRLVLELPCLNKIAQLIVNGANNPAITLFGIFGDIREPDPNMRHQWCYTKEEITAILKECGFSAEVEEPVFHMKKRDMRVIARSI